MSGSLNYCHRKRWHLVWVYDWKLRLLPQEKVALGWVYDWKLRLLPQDKKSLALGIFALL